MARLVAVLTFSGVCAARAGDLLSWDEAYSRAEAKLSLMSTEQKHSLMSGIGWNGTYPTAQPERGFYVGNTPAIPDLGIPSLNIHDSSAGFRTISDDLIGTVTSWPSPLALAATWDRSLVRSYAEALGEEFRGKGANVVLGPGVNVHRVARGGRNFEYISGEDPFLGSQLAAEFVHGVQSRNVMAMVKHFAFNEQETNRRAESSNVDLKTAWELYYPPFQAAVDAGVGATMCSYNKVNGVFSCSNEQLLHDLKDEMGFRGFVQSDWWASHNTSVAEGLDQEMPGTPDFSFLGSQRLDTVPDDKVDDSVRRILASMYRLDIIDNDSNSCTPPNCAEWLAANVTSAEHWALALQIAADSVVLLKNEDGVLPLSPNPGGAAATRTIAVVGSAAAAGVYRGDVWGVGDYYTGGGSSRVIPAHVVTPLDAIAGRAAQDGIEVFSSPSNDVGAAIAISEEADVTIIVVGATSGESSDRAGLSLDADMDSLISEVASSNWGLGKKTVVLAQIPGAVLMPWRDAVSAILCMFMGGQETGPAWASVLFGDSPPGGRLPLMIPQLDDDTISPNSSLSFEYSEGLETSYRSRSFDAAYPFGHGLSYSSFEYGQIHLKFGYGRSYSLLLTAQINNTGNVTAPVVAQLYIEFPQEARQPRSILKGFQKRIVAAGGAVEVVFELSARDLAYWETGTWVMVPSITAKLGASSDDIRQELRIATGIRSFRVIT